MRQKIIVGLVILLMAALVPGMNALGGTEHQESFTNEVDEATRVNIECVPGQLEAALLREESRGAHFRSDFPQSSSQWQCHIVLTQ